MYRRTNKRIKKGKKKWNQKLSVVKEERIRIFSKKEEKKEKKEGK